MVCPNVECCLFKALADENEFVRDTALRSGQRIVNMYADKSVELLLPELEKGLFDDNWRIRWCSVQLLGDLLYKLSGNIQASNTYLQYYQQGNITLLLTCNRSSVRLSRFMISNFHEQLL